ncbi:MAG: acetylglutamate kinase, partial [Saprospiraceae bacterium]|nr:acetylglutamate kinase [Saprospiraceae bacterium]
MKISQKPLVLIKYGGNAMLSEELKKEVIDRILHLHRQGFSVVLAHGGGPFIRRLLEVAGIPSEFVGGHRKTTPEALKYIEMALKGEVNGSLVNLLNRTGLKAVGLSGKDGATIRVRKRYHLSRENGREERHDLGRVGDIESVDTSLIELLLQEGYVPVITCIASDEHGDDFNVNGDMFAGHIAGALGAAHYLVLTDVDGLMRDVDRPDSLIEHLRVDEID